MNNIRHTVSSSHLFLSNSFFVFLFRVRSFFFLLSLFFPAVEKKKHEQQQKAANASINNQTHKEYSEQA